MSDQIFERLVAEIEDLKRKVEQLSTVEGGKFVPLTTPLTSTAWDGDSFSTTAKTKIDLSAVFGVPAGVKAISVFIMAKDSGSLSGNCLFALSPNNTAGSYPVACKMLGLPNDTYVHESGTVPCDVNGDVYYQCLATGTGTLDVIIEIWGYFL